MQGLNDVFREFEVQRRTLSEQLVQASRLVEQIGLVTLKNTVNELNDRVASSTFKVLVLGEFNRGKSTLINALLGMPVLPTSMLPCTGVIVEIKWAEEPRAIVHFAASVPQTLPEGLPRIGREHIARMRSLGSVPPLEIAVEQISEYVKVNNLADQDGDADAHSLVDHVELFWPSLLCHGGVVLVDSPGLNEHEVREKLSNSYLKDADAVLIVLSCTHLSSKSELQHVDAHVRSLGHDRLFWICNHLDAVPREERESIKAHARRKLGPRTAYGEDGIFFLSAKVALDGRIANDSRRVSASGILKFEETLSRFLVQERGRVKLLQPANNCRKLLTTVVVESVPEQRRLLESELPVLKERAAAIQPDLRRAETKKQLVMERMERHFNGLADQVRREARLHQEEVANQVVKWTEQMDFQNSINSFKFWSIKEQGTRLCKEVVDRLSLRIGESHAEWEKNRLVPLVERRIQDLLEDLNAPLKDFLNQVRELRGLMAGIEMEHSQSVDNVSALERILSAAGGFVLAGVGSALEGATMGYKGMLHGLAPQIGVGLGVYVLFGWNPALLVAALLGTAIVRNIMHGTSLTKKSAEQIAKALGEQLLRDAGDAADRVSKKILEGTEPLKTAIHTGLDREIQSLRDELTAAIRAKQAGESSVREKRQALELVQANLQAIDLKLTELILALVERSA